MTRCVGRGVREEMAKLTLARKIAAIVSASVEERRALESEETDDASDIALGCGRARSEGDSLGVRHGSEDVGHNAFHP